MQKQIIVNNLLINYYSLNDSKANVQTLLFLHGWRSSAQAWQGIISRIKDQESRIVALDLPGFGGSQTPVQPFSVEDYCSIVEEFVNKLGLQNVVAVGHSFGGRVGIKLAATRPGLIRKLVLVDSAGFATSNARKSFLGIIAKCVKPFFRSAFMQPLRRKIYQTIGAEDYVETPELQQTFVNVINEDLSGFFKDIHLPTLIVWGKNDSDTPVQFADRMHQGIANSELVILPKAGHFSFLDQPQIFAETLLKFIK
jgi:pimeloyl-ACP methyl ester carboxylesterase